MFSFSRLNEIRENRYLKGQRKKYPLSQTTIISQNCIGGVLYHRQNARFLSPTIGCAIRGENFVRLCENIQDVLSNDCVAAGEANIPTESGPLSYPLLSTCGITIDAIHYDTAEEAVSKWNTRRRRANKDRIVVLANTWDLQNDDALIERILKIAYPKLIFTDLPKYKNTPHFLFLDKKYRRNDRGVPLPLLMNKFSNEPKIVAERFNIYKLIFRAVSTSPRR